MYIVNFVSTCWIWLIRWMFNLTQVVMAYSSLFTPSLENVQLFFIGLFWSGYARAYREKFNLRIVRLRLLVYQFLFKDWCIYNLRKHFFNCTCLTYVVMFFKFVRHRFCTRKDIQIWPTNPFIEVAVPYLLIECPLAKPHIIASTRRVYICMGIKLQLF